MGNMKNNTLALFEGLYANFEGIYASLWRLTSMSPKGGLDLRIPPGLLEGVTFLAVAIVDKKYGIT
jgi:hypothetical protein